jgi:hypothetical protein
LAFFGIFEREIVHRAICLRGEDVQVEVVDNVRDIGDGMGAIANETIDPYARR